MRILLVQHAPYVPAHGGANLSNRLVLEALAARGHACRAVALARARSTSVPQPTGDDVAVLMDELAARGIAPVRAGEQDVAFTLGGVAVRAFADARQLRGSLAAEAREFRPDWMLVSSEDPGQRLLAAALDAAPARVVYLARTSLALPCGPDAAVPSERGTALLRRAAAVICISPFVTEYLERWAGIDGVVLPISPCGAVRPAARPPAARRFVTMINPCVVKGVDLFLRLAQRMPDVAFAAVPTWGTTTADRQRLDAAANIALLPPRDEVDDIYDETRVLLVPSLWAEARGRVVLEAHVRGIPVLAADSAGLRGEMGGLDYLLPVVPIREYGARLDDRLIPQAVVPPQPIDPWERALRQLLTDTDRYEALSDASRRHGAARAGTTIEPFETFLQTCRPPADTADGALTRPDTRLDATRPRDLTAEQRAYLVTRLRAGESGAGR